MKNLLLIAIAIVLTSSCCVPVKDERDIIEIEISGSTYHAEVAEFKFDNCEYIAIRINSEKFGITHKGNCSNCNNTQPKEDDYWSNY